MQCSDRGHFDCIDPTTKVSTESHTIITEDTTTIVSTGSHTLNTEDITVTTTTTDQTDFSPEEFLRTLGLFGLSAAVVVDTGVTIGTLKLVNRRMQRVSSENNMKDVDIMKEGETFLEQRMRNMIDSIQNSDPENIDLMTYPSKNVPPVGHQIHFPVFGSTYFNRGPTADHAYYPYIDSLPYTVEGYLDLSRV